MISKEGDAANVGRLTIITVTNTGSPRHMNQYAQDTMTCVNHYGCPNRFITFPMERNSYNAASGTNLK